MAEGHTSSEAIDIKRLILILGLAAFIVLADNWVVSPILPAIAKAFHTQPAHAGILITAYMLPFGIFQLIYGPLADRFGKLKVILFAMIFFTGASALCGIGIGVINLAMYRALTGIFAAAITPVSLALIADVVPIERRQAAIGSFLGIALLGQSLSMGIGGTIAQFVSWRGVFFIYAALSAAITALLFVASRDLRGQLSRDPNSKFVAPYINLLGHSPSVKAYLIIFFEGFFIFGSFSYLGAYMSHGFKLSYMSIGLILTLFGIGSLVAGKLSGKLAVAIGRKRLIGIGLFLSSLALIAVPMLSTSVAFTTISILALGLGTMLTHSTLITLATEFAQKARGVAMSLVAFSLMVGGATGTSTGGHLVAAYGYKSLFLIFGLALFSVSIFAPFAISDEKPVRQEVGSV